jgi:uncharacterized membrane protein YcaP (DUF421 family)
MLDDIRDIAITVFGCHRHVGPWQMMARGAVTFFYAWMLIRISGRRSFGIKTPPDNIIVILLGTLLGRAVVGVSPAGPIAATTLVTVLLHRFICYAGVRWKPVRRLLEGDKITLFSDGKFNHENLRRAMVTQEDVFRSMRKLMQTDDVAAIQRAYMERNGKITVVRKRER